MSASNVSTLLGSDRPFQCLVCRSRFTRYENLKRHAALHSHSADQSSFPCEFCPVTFSRRDLRSRHLKRKHPEHEKRRGSERLGYAQAVTIESSQSSICTNNKVLPMSPAETRYAQRSRLPRDEKELEIDGMLWQMELPGMQGDQDFDIDYSRHKTSPVSTRRSFYVEEMNTPNYNIGSWLTQRPSMSESTSIPGHSFHNTTGGAENLESAFASSHHSESHVHRTTQLQPSFSDVISECSSPMQHIPDGLSPKDLSHLLEDWFPTAAQISRGYQLYFAHVSHFVPFLHRPTFDAAEIARHLGLSMLCIAYQHGEDPECFDQAGSGVNLSLKCFHRARVLAAAEEESGDDLLHTITLVQTYWLLQVCVMMYICGKDSAYGLKMHSRMISLTRFGGLTQPIPTEFVTAADLESMWHDFIKTESHKRTLLAVHQLDALWYQLFSIPRSLSHLEIKHDLPCPEKCWIASSSAQWAHRQLTTRQSTSPMQYADAVRFFLSPEPDFDSFPTFDPYGAINIAQFLLSSAREISGWSTMTGRFSLERIEPLRASLVALERFIRPQAEGERSTHAVSCGATWEMAMIELQMWSPSHTCGIVEGSVDAFLKQSTFLASSWGSLYDPNHTNPIQPHLNWFLHYLDTTLVPDLETPWISLYAYKAFLIAWSLVRRGASGVMQVVGVADGDVKGAVEWAKTVFGRRKRLRIGELVCLCLDALDG